MAVIDDPQAWILLMFQKEEREGRGEHCQSFPNGTVVEFLPLNHGERVYGVYKNKYYFTPAAVYVSSGVKPIRIAWRDVRSCTTRHGDGQKTSTVTLKNGTAHKIDMCEMVTGWSSRISQLFHQMIDRHGIDANLGPALMKLDDFFAQAEDAYCLFPNLEPHPSLTQLRDSLTQLMAINGVSEVRIVVADDAETVGVAIAIRTSLDESALIQWVTSLGADGLFDSTADLGRQFDSIPNGQRILQAVWD